MIMGWAKGRIELNGKEIPVEEADRLERVDEVKVRDMIDVPELDYDRESVIGGTGEWNREADANPGSFSFTMKLSKEQGREVSRNVVRLYAQASAKELRDDLHYRRQYGLRVPRKLKKKAKRWLAEEVAKQWHVSTNEVLKMMKSRGCRN